MKNVLFQPTLLSELHLIRVYRVVKAVFVASYNMWNRVSESPTLTFLNVIPIQAPLLNIIPIQVLFRIST